MRKIVFILLSVIIIANEAVTVTDESDFPTTTEISHENFDDDQEDWILEEEDTTVTTLKSSSPEGGDDMIVNDTTPVPPDRRWPDGRIIYIIDDIFTDSEREVIKGAMEELTQRTCVRFHPRSTSQPEIGYVNITGHSKFCTSYIGRHGGLQYVTLNAGSECLNHGTVLHELMHTVGFYHEQNRPDRDGFIDIHWDNLNKGEIYKLQYKKMQDVYNTTFGLPYDYHSIMHYAPKAFSAHGSYTMSPKIGQFEIGQRVGLSLTDIARIKLMYEFTDSNCNCTGFLCSTTGECIWSDGRCDGKIDCKDFSDEKNCDEFKCPENRFSCDQSQCIRSEERCDGIEDCRNGFDERNCTTCSGHAFTCGNGECTHMFNKCDGVEDCQDGSDERNCTSCPKYQFMCREEVKCAFKSERCDGKKDCKDGEDEENCSMCNSDEFECADGECVELRGQCDTVKDCRDGSDEKDCPNECPAEAFRCDSGQCVPGSEKCDGFIGCADGSDENSCTMTGCTDNKEACELWKRTTRKKEKLKAQIKEYYNSRL